jgi:GMP synthase (glutamine-hydrolysing)
MPLHWHGDTFDIPAGAVKVAYNEATENQAFVYNNKVVALQFHLEATENSLKDLIQNSQEELKETGKYIQPPEKMLSNKDYFRVSNFLMEKLLENLSKGV